jgi:hypothetical protein
MKSDQTTFQPNAKKIIRKPHKDPKAWSLKTKSHDIS